MQRYTQRYILNLSNLEKKFNIPKQALTKKLYFDLVYYT